ncbi:MAG: fibronectin type III domain-containing protein [Blastococcus sp.]|nr:fibronectin type III domain-containing protein [Blastococcus sp.]
MDTRIRERRDSSGTRRRGPARRRWTLPALGGLAAVLAVVSTSAVAAVPAFPDNLVVFPDRDFISAEGFAGHEGETGLVEVTRPGVGVIGSARVLMGPGDVPFEINHPGGACWGAGTDLQVTPDIRPGDVVSLDLPGVDADVTTQDGFVTGVNYVDGASTFTVVGHIGAGVNQDNTEQRIVNPDLKDTAVGRRDIRAIPGPLTPDRNGVYESSLEFSGETFTATYVFTDPAVARMAATGGGERLLTWQETDVDGNRQGITIAEFGELGGPGMGGCPNGPLVSGPRGPSSVTAANVSGSSIRVNWTPAVAIPGTPAITGYRVTAVAQTVTGGEQIEIGRRITGQAATGTTITGLSGGETYDVYVTSVSSVGETFPAIHAIPVTDVTDPAVSADPAGGTYASARTVRLGADEPNADIYYTLDGSSPLDSKDQLAPDAIRYTGPITIATTTTLRAVAFDPSGNVSTVIEETYTIDSNGVVPGAPTIDSATPELGAIDLRWSIDPEFTVTDYLVQVNEADGSPRTDLAENPIATTDTQLTVTGLSEGTPYYFTVTARNVEGPGPASAQFGPVSPLGAIVADAGPDRSVTRGLAPTVVTLDGGGSTAGATYLWEQIGAGPGDAAVLTGANTLTPSFTLPLFAVPATNGPRTFRLTVTGGDGTVRTDEVVITPVRGDNVTVGQARWKAGDFRVDGTGTVNGAVVRIHSGSLNGPSLGTATVTAGVWNLRLRNNQAPAARPASLWIESTLGTTVGPVTVN